MKKTAPAMYNNWYTQEQAAALIVLYNNMTARAGTCKQDCKHCDNCKMKFARTERGTAYAFYCAIADAHGLNPYNNSPADLLTETRDCIKFELDL